MGTQGGRTKITGSTRCVGLPQDMRGRQQVSCRVGELASERVRGRGPLWSTWATERHGPLSLVCYASGADVAGYLRRW